MSLDWCPGIREACVHWRDAPMLQQTFEALGRRCKNSQPSPTLGTLSTFNQPSFP